MQRNCLIAVADGDGITLEHELSVVNRYSADLSLNTHSSTPWFPS